MMDAEVLDFLATKLKKRVEVARALGIDPRVLSNWNERGISAAMRPKVWALANRHGARLPQKWLTDRAEAA